MNRKKKKKFHKEVGDFVTTALILGFINWMTSPYPWSFWVIGIWGACLFGQYVQIIMDDKLEDDFDLDQHSNHVTESKAWKEKDMV